MGRWRWLQVAVLACAVVGAGGCSGGGSSMPSLAELTPGAWNVLEPGGDTICSRGTPFVFLVWPGRNDRVVLNFVGGGACWNELTCSLAGATFSETVDEVRDGLLAGEGPGLFDMTNPDNPVSDWTHVVIPYCTGDVHWGDNVVMYNQDITIHHKGAVNTRAVLSWVYDNIRAPDRVLTTGCSAGGYGASMWAAHVMHAYPDAYQVMLADSAAGVITDTFFMDSFPSWNATAAFPDFIPGFNADTIMSLPDYYDAFADYFPNHVFAQYNTVLDWNQTFFYTAMGGTGGADGWSARMRDHVYEVANHAPANYRYFIGGDDPATSFDESTVHCILNPDAGNPQFPDRDTATAQTGQMFTSYESGGVKFLDWLGDLIDPAQDAPNVSCSGCEPAPLP